MSYTFLLEQGEESSAECFSDIPASVLLRLNLTAEKSYCSVNETECSQDSRFGTMPKHLTDPHGEEELKSFVLVSRVRTSQQPETEMAWKACDRDCGPKSRGSFAKWNRSTYSWKTPQLSLFGGLEEFSETWPRWGMMRHGECFPLPMLEHLTFEKGSGFFATPMASDGRPVHNFTITQIRRHQENGTHASKMLYELLEMGIQIADIPKIYELAMHWPETWSDLQPLEMGKFQQWLDSHGKT